jgi:hypothetical protein
MKPQKKEWKTPELIVLVRSKPEEAVLTGCKTQTKGGNGSNQAANGCRVTTTCAPCTAYATS